MSGKKKRQRRNRRNRNKQRRPLTPNEIVLVEAKEASHPLHSWPTTLVQLLLEFKTEMEKFEREFNRILSKAHDNYVQLDAILGFIRMHHPNAVPLIELGLERDTKVLDALFSTLLHDQCFLGAVEDDGCDVIIDATNRHLHDLFIQPLPFEEVAKKALKQAQALQRAAKELGDKDWLP